MSTVGNRTVGTLVVGAGPTGLGAAWALQRAGRDHLVLEAAHTPGGAAASRQVDGFSWDLGGHVIHSHFPQFDEAVLASRTPMTQVERSGAVWAPDGFVDVPYQQQLDELPADIRPGAPAANLDEYFRNEMGAALHAEFFAPFNTKMWAHPLDGLSHEWTSQRAGSNAANVPQVGLRKDLVARREFFPYPLFGTGDLWTRLAAPLSERIRYGVRVSAVDLARRIATLDDGSSVRYDELISTMPLDDLLRRAGEPRLAGLGARLVHCATNLLGLGVRGLPPTMLAGRTYIYNADPATAWHRASVLSNYSPANAPDGHWSILFEANSSAHRSVDPAALRSSALAFLDRVGADTGRVTSVWTAGLDRGYPLPTLERDEVLRTVHATLEASGVVSRGRFGGWRYESCNQDYSFAQGVEAVEHPGSAEVLWNPQRF